MKSYSINLADSGNYIIIKVVGGIDSEVAISYIKDSHKMGTETGIIKFLLDAREAPNVQSTGDNFNFAADELEIIEGFNRTAIVAMLVAEDDHSHDFIETVMSNRGYKTRLFRSYDEAMKYLEETE